MTRHKMIRRNVDAAQPLGAYGRGVPIKPLDERPRRRDVMLAVALALLGVVEWLTSGDRVVDPWPFVLATAAMAAAAGWRRLRPFTSAVLVGAVFAAYPFVTPHAAESAVQALLLLVSAYSVAAFAPLRPALAGLGVLVVAGAVRSYDMGVYDGDAVVVNNLWALGAWVVGRGVHLRETRARVAELAVAHSERLRAEAERESASLERQRIARELHDIVAHAVTVMVVQARGGRRLLEHDVARSRAAFDAIEQMGAEAVNELRRLFSVLSEQETATPAEVRSGPAELEALVDGVRATGLPVSLRIDGVPTESPASVDVSAFRVVQEALTNAMRHGTAAPAEVHVAYHPDRIEVDVQSAMGITSTLAGTGRGLAGLRERVRLTGGSLAAGEQPGGRYGVHAVLPFEGDLV
jgi:signal transduction histidine kinase